MQAIGQLTGGIAQDVNNLLAGLSGSLELFAGASHKIAGRASANTSKTHRTCSVADTTIACVREAQTIDPKDVDANRAIAGMADMLRRSVGPTVLSKS